MKTVENIMNMFLYQLAVCFIVVICVHKVLLLCGPTCCSVVMSFFKRRGSKKKKDEDIEREDLNKKVK